MYLGEVDYLTIATNEEYTIAKECLKTKNLAK
jgi:hypothetical protein